MPVASDTRLPDMRRHRAIRRLRCAPRVVAALTVAAGLAAGADAQAHVGTARLHVPDRAAKTAPHLSFDLPAGYRQTVGATNGLPLIGRYRRHTSTWTGLSCVVELTVVGRAQPQPLTMHDGALVFGTTRLRVRGRGRHGAVRWYLGSVHDGWQRLTDGNRLTGIAVFAVPRAYRTRARRWALAEMGLVSYPDSAPDGRTRRQRQLACDTVRDAAAEELQEQLYSVRLARGPAARPRGIAVEATTALGPLLWSDDFDGHRLDPSKWSFRATGLRHDGVLTPEAVSVGDGMLTIKTYTESGKHYSGMISTQQDGYGGFEQKYGYFEARMRFNSAPGQWSAFWLQSPTVGNPMGDPARAGVEMDVVEHRARCLRPPSQAPPDVCAPATDITNRVQHGLIWDGYGDESQATVRLSDPWPWFGNGAWHDWALRWSPSELRFYFDGAPVWSMSGPISQRSEYIILSSEVGRFMAGDIPADGYGARSKTATNVQVDYVRVWALR